MQNKEQDVKRNAFLEALGKESKQLEIPLEEDPDLKTGEPEELKELEEEEPETDPGDAVVPARQPDTVGRAALLVWSILKKIFRPIKKIADMFLAPVFKPFKKGADKVTGKDWALFLSLLVTIAAIVAAPMLVVKIQSTYKEAESIYAPRLGQIFTWEKGGTFTCDGEEAVWFVPKDGEKLNMTGVPFYYTDQDALLWTNTGIWYSVEKDMGWGKVPRFSNVSAQSGSGVIRTSGGKEYMKGGFLYDNRNTYVFLEGVTLQFNGKELFLPPLSSVEAVNGSTIDIYSYGGDTTAELLSTDAAASFSNGARLDLTGDVLYYYNGTFRLIYCTLEGVPMLQE